MSASLVGSEMCIRDSPPPLRPRHGVSLLGAPKGAAFRGSAPRCPAPVSYTHLTMPTICSV
eukprot:4109002-Alexandrium_andersonii.AAC.1